MGHVDQARSSLEGLQPLQSRIDVVAAEPQDLLVERHLAGEMLEQQGFGDLRRLGDLLRRGAAKPLRANSGKAASTMPLRRSRHESDATMQR